MRVLLRVLSPLLGLALAAVGALLVIEVVAAWFRPDATDGLLVPWASWRTGIEGLTWADPVVRWIAVGVGVLGLFLLLVSLSGRRRDIVLDSPGDAMTVTTSPRVLARLVGRRVRGTDGVAEASVTATRTKVSVTARGYGDATPQLRSTVGEQVTALLTELPLHRRPRVAVSVHNRKGPR